MPAKAHNNHRDTPRKSNGTTRAGRCTDASPARQARINSPEQSLKHWCQAGPGRLNRPAVLEQCPRLRRLGCAVLRSSWPHGDSKPLLFAPHTWSALSWRQRRHCVQHAPGLCRRRASVSSTVAEDPREVDSAGPNRQLVGLIRSRDPDGYPRPKHNRIPSSGAPCNPMKKSREVPLRKSLFRHSLPKGHLPRIYH